MGPEARHDALSGATLLLTHDTAGPLRKRSGPVLQAGCKGDTRGAEQQRRLPDVVVVHDERGPGADQGELSKGAYTKAAPSQRDVDTGAERHAEQDGIARLDVGGFVGAAFE